MVTEAKSVDWQSFTDLVNCVQNMLQANIDLVAHLQDLQNRVEALEEEEFGSDLDDFDEDLDEDALEEGSEGDDPVVGGLDLGVVLLKPDGSVTIPGGAA